MMARCFCSPCTKKSRTTREADHLALSLHNLEFQALQMADAFRY
jgi:hypothetical protein